MVEHGAATPSILDQLTARPLSGSMAAPVHESGIVTGCLLVGSHVADRHFEESEQQMLRALAEHVSLALTDAHTVDRMYQAFHDSLTGLASRALFMDRLGSALADARRDGATTALLFVDLDRFKSINDTLGHAVGDQVLMATAERLREQLRAGDLAARLGGDEFAIVLSGITGAASAVAVADRLVEALADPVLAGGRWLPMLASIGIAICSPGELESAELIRRADVAMYQAKRGGRGRHAMYTGEIEQAFATGLAS
jgi:diguanylate cyclase (GGDEF)-like protein